VSLIEVLLNAILDNKLSLTHILNSEVYKWMKKNISGFEESQSLVSPGRLYTLISECFMNRSYGEGRGGAEGFSLTRPLHP